MADRSILRLQSTSSVPFSYPVLFGRDLLNGDPSTLARLFQDLDTSPTQRRCLMFIDRGLVDAQPSGWIEDVESHWRTSSGLPEMASAPVVVPGGEAIKNDYRTLMSVVDQVLESRLCRHSFMIVVGGGAVLDAVGFAASILHRGMRIVRFPSTVLAQNDAGIGVKTGMNLHGGKNTIGTFAPPSAVVNDLALLEPLPQRHWRSGISEAFKVAMIRDESFFRWLCDHADRLGARDQTVMDRLIIRCAELHIQHIAEGGDPFETGSARPLDFGHWAAHKLEALTAYELTHGEAVGIGILLDASYAAGQGWLDRSIVNDLHTALQRCGLPVFHEALLEAEGDGRLRVLAGLDEFQEHLGGELCVTFPHGVGHRREESVINLDAMNRCIRDLTACTATAESN